MRIEYSSKLGSAHVSGLAEGERLFMVRESDRHFADTIHAYLQLARTLTPQARQALGDKAKRAHGRPNHLPDGGVHEVTIIASAEDAPKAYEVARERINTNINTESSELEELRTTNAALVARVAALEAICADASERLKKTPGAGEVRKALASAAKQ